MNWDLNSDCKLVVSENDVYISSIVLREAENKLNLLDKQKVSVAKKWVNPFDTVDIIVGPPYIINKSYHELWDILYNHALPILQTRKLLHSLHLGEIDGCFIQVVEFFWCRHLNRCKSMWRWNAVRSFDNITSNEWKYQESGNIIHAELIGDETLPLQCSNADIVTSNQINESEVHNQELLSATIRHSVNCCNPGGLVIIKLGNMFTLETREIIMNQAMPYFTQSFIVKPHISDICSSERFYVGIQKLYSPVTSLGKHVKSRLREIAIGLVDLQVRSINNARDIAIKEIDIATLDTSKSTTHFVNALECCVNIGCPNPLLPSSHK